MSYYCKIMRWFCEEEEQIDGKCGSKLKCIILDMIEFVKLALVNPVGNVMEKLHQLETLESLGSYGLYPNSRGSSGRYFSIVESSTINR
ncbi:unnamed protein product [Camellia sinensis]